MLFVLVNIRRGTYSFSVQRIQIANFKYWTLKIDKILSLPIKSYALIQFFGTFETPRTTGGVSPTIFLNEKSSSFWRHMVTPLETVQLSRTADFSFPIPPPSLHLRCHNYCSSSFLKYDSIDFFFTIYQHQHL